MYTSFEHRMGNASVFEYLNSIYAAIKENISVRNSSGLKAKEPKYQHTQREDRENRKHAQTRTSTH